MVGGCAYASAGPEVPRWLATGGEGTAGEFTRPASSPPVCPVGIVTERDLVVRGMVRRIPTDARIDNVMTTELVTLPAGADLHEAMGLFHRHPIRRLPLLEDGRMIGMLTVDDLAINLVSELDSLFRPTSARSCSVPRSRRRR